MLSIGPFGADTLSLPTASGSGLSVLVGLFILLLAAKVGEEIFRRIGQPAVVGELLGGFVVGPNALALVTPGETAIVLGEIGVVILLFAVGLETRTDDLLRVGRPAALTAVLGVIFPMAAGIGYGLLMGEEAFAAIFVGLALAATSIGITSRVLADLGVLERRFARVIVGAAVIDDVLALILIGIVSGAAKGDLGLATLMLVVAAVGFVGLGLVIARRARGLRREVFTWPLFADTPLVPAFLVMLALAILAQWIGLAAIIGAFVAGLIIAETEAQEELERDVRPLTAIFAPFFFAVTGAQIDLAALLRPELAMAAVVLAGLGFATKVLGGYLGAWSLGRQSALAVGVGMAPRGEVGIVVSQLGLALGLLSTDLFSVVLVAVVLTTVAAPVLLGSVIRRVPADEPRGPGAGAGPDSRTGGGSWPDDVPLAGGGPAADTGTGHAAPDLGTASG
jgi:Kef-type K+ transport system membrane component KefB